MKNLLDIVEETLQITGELTAKEIWEKAHELGTIGDFISKGKTPIATISAICYLDIKKKNGNSRFVQSGHPIKIGLNKTTESSSHSIKAGTFEEYRKKFNIKKYREKQVRDLKNCAEKYLKTEDFKKSGLDQYPAFLRAHEYIGANFKKMAEEILIGDLAPFAIIKTQEYGENGPYMNSYFESFGKSFEKITPSFFNGKYSVNINQSYSPRWKKDNNYIMGVHFKWGGKVKDKVNDFFQKDLKQIKKVAKENKDINIYIFWYCNVDEKSSYGLEGRNIFSEEIDKFQKEGYSNIFFWNFDDIKTFPL